ncbi:hypothetical protein H1R20_g12862, partial [Candolleomyces eurysporus]
MARTKRSSQLSASSKPKASSPEYLPDGYELVENPPPSTQAQIPDTPTPSSGKRRVREDANPTPPPAKKNRNMAPSAKPPAEVVAESDEEDDDSSSTTARSVSEATECADADIEDDGMETPKASKIMGKKKAMNLKTQLGGKLGINSSEEPGQSSVSGPPAAPIITLPSSSFTLENKAEWADSYVDRNGKTHLFVKARSADDPLLMNKDILDPYMAKHGHYKNLPNANKLQLPAMNERHNEFTNGSITSLVPGLSIQTWECFGIDKAYVASLHRFKRQANIANASTVDVTDLVFKEAWSNAGPGCAYIACDKATGRPTTFLLVGGVMESFLVAGKNVGYEGKAPCAKGVLILGHRCEHERASCTFATLWQGEDIAVPIQRRHITLQTRNRPNNPTASVPSTPKADDIVKIGKMEVKVYKSRDGNGSPNKPAFSANKTYIDWNEKVPVYDGRNEAFDPNDVAGSLAHLPDYASSDGELPEGTGVVVGYTAATSKFLSIWKLTFNIMWVVVIAD